VQGLLRTSDAVSPNVTVTDVVGSLTLLALIYALLFVAWLRVVTGIIRKGPQGVADSLGGTDEVGPTPTATV
jgi:cytochrome d ubiquinol oxidase subunit I